MSEESSPVNPFVLEAALFASSEPLPIDKLRLLFAEDERPSAAEVKQALQTLQAHYEERGIELVEVASGYRFQVGEAWSPWLSRLWEKKPARHSRALLETLALVAYRQPITRAEIEDVRGVVVSSNIIRTLLDREWIKVSGYRDTPGKPALFSTTPHFLNDLNMTSLSELPELMPTNDMETVEKTLSEQLHIHLDTNAAISQAEQTEGEPINMTPTVRTLDDDAITSALAAADELIEKTQAADEAAQEGQQEEEEASIESEDTMNANHSDDE